MRGLKVTALVAIFLAGLLTLPARGDVLSPAKSPMPGTLNYVEGQASIGSESLTSKSVGSAELEPGQTLSSQNGKVEILLTPGVFLRVGSNSSVKMISPSLANTEVEVGRGEAQIEVDQIFKENRLLVREDGATTQLQKRGFYDFDADQNVVRVLQGQAILRDGDRQIKIKGGHEVALNAPELKAQKFDKKDLEASDLYRWSSLRSEYVAEANLQQAPTYIVGNGFGPGWWGPGWYWDPYFSFYTFIPGDGMLYSPFGWGFYSPFWAPAYWGAGYYGRVYPTVGPHWRPAGRAGFGASRQGGFRGGGFHSGGFGGGHFGGGHGGMGHFGRG